MGEEEYTYTYDPASGEYIVDIPTEGEWALTADNVVRITQDGIIKMSSVRQPYNLTVDNHLYPTDDSINNLVDTIKDSSGQSHQVNVPITVPTSYTGNPSLTSALHQLMIAGSGIMNNWNNDPEKPEVVYSTTRAQTYNTQLQAVKDLINQSIANGEELPQSYTDFLKYNSI